MHKSNCARKKRVRTVFCMGCSCGPWPDRPEIGTGTAERSVTELMTETIDDRCYHAAVNLYNGKVVKVRQSVVAAVGVPTLMQTIKDWLHYQCMEDIHALPCESFDPKEFRVWAEAVEGGLRFHAKRIA